MKIWRSSDDKAIKYLAKLDRRIFAVLSPALESKVRSVVQAICNKGDKALLAMVRKFDLRGLKVGDFRLQGRIEGQEEVGEEFIEAVELVLANLKEFHAHQVLKGYTLEGDGGDLGVRVRPLESVGVYVPGGAAVYLSSLMMAVIPARVAGVERIAVATPPRAFLSSPHLRYLLERLNIHEVYLMGGAHAIAALACGTDSVTPVDKIVGPGGRWVSAAKRAVFGMVGVDMIAGPSELVVVADSSAEPELVAADLLAQAEHDPDALALLLTNSRTLAEKVERRVSARLKRLPAEAAARVALRRWGAIIVTADVEEAVAICDRVAPEHVELHVKDPLRLVDRIERAGAVYLGPWSPAVLGDYSVGTNHVLPTAGAARFSSPLGVWDFVHRITVVQVAPHRYGVLAEAAGRLAELEALPLHKEALQAGSRGRV